MGDLTADFSRIEFACKCGCGEDTIDFLLLEILQELRDTLGEEITINSGVRCIKHNTSVGGSFGSQHLRGRAVDFVVNKVHPDTVHATLSYWFPDMYGLGKYPTFTHFDTRTAGPSRWEG